MSVPRGYEIQPTPDDVALVEAYLAADLRAKEATDYADKLKAALKMRMVDSPEAGYGDSIDVSLQVGNVKATVRQQETWRVDTARLKREQAAIYAAYSKKSTSTVMRFSVN